MGYISADTFDKGRNLGVRGEPLNSYTPIKMTHRLLIKNIKLNKK